MCSTARNEGGKPQEMVMSWRRSVIAACCHAHADIRIERIAMPFQPRLTLITVGARDFEKLRAFYFGLGWEPRVQTDDFCAFRLGGVMFALWPMENLAAESGVGSGAPAGFTLAWNVDTRDQVDELFAELVSKGATPVLEPVDMEWGGRSSYVADPEGNRWELAWAPGMQLDERGAVLDFG